jgi:hypothetical protein
MMDQQEQTCTSSTAVCVPAQRRARPCTNAQCCLLRAGICLAAAVSGASAFAVQPGSLLQRSGGAITAGSISPAFGNRIVAAQQLRLNGSAVTRMVS